MPGQDVAPAAPVSTSTQRRRSTHDDMGRLLRDRIAAWEHADPASPETADMAARRRAVVEGILRLLHPLTRYVRHWRERWVGSGLVPADALPVDDLVAATYLAAIDAAGGAPPARSLYPWLRQIARQTVRQLAAAEAERRQRERSLETPLRVPGDEWPDVVLRLGDVLVDPSARLPEEVFEQDETRRALDRLLVLLPERWREVFLLRAVDGWGDDAIAQAEGLSPTEVRPIVDASRDFLRAWLDDLRGEQADRAASTGVDVSELRPVESRG